MNMRDRNMVGGVMVALMVLGTGALGGGCDDDNNDNGGRGGSGGNISVTTGRGGSSGGGNGTAGNGGATVLSDAQIGAIMIEANGGEVHAGDVATSRAVDAGTVSFAMMMVTDHTMANQRLQSVLQQANITAADSAERQALASQAQQVLDMLWAAPVSAFDQMYIQSQVTMHTMVLQMLDARLIPATQNAALKAELQTERTAVMTHLTKAQQIAGTLTGAGGTGGAGASGGTGGAGASGGTGGH
jgi:predicted outer membrane protein